MSDNYNELFIIDLGLCKPISEIQDSDNNEIYGVLPYMAPEILRKPYTPASDIYSFSMIMWDLHQVNLHLIMNHMIMNFS
jgi:serine/threonine protein kinase